jgi:hypothetical protein
MTLCMARSSHFYRAKFIPQHCVNRPTIDFTDRGNDAALLQMGNGNQNDQ